MSAPPNYPYHACSVIQILGFTCQIKKNVTLFIFYTMSLFASTVIQFSQEEKELH